MSDYNSTALASARDRGLTAADVRAIIGAPDGLQQACSLAGIDPARLVPVLHFDGTPITARFIARAIGEHLNALKVTPLRKVGA